MLKTLSVLHTPELLHVLASMGHGDEVALVDCNFPAASMAQRLVRLDGAYLPAVLEACMQLLPLDTFVDKPALQESLRERGPASFEERVCRRRYRVGGAAYRLPIQPADTLRRDAPTVAPLKPLENCNPQARLHPRGPSMPERAVVPVCAKHSRFST